MASTPNPVTFREFCPLYHLLNAIPAKVQKGFRSLVVYLTALDTNGDYIAVGSSIGMLYLYCRHLGHMRKYNFEVSLGAPREVPDVPSRLCSVTSCHQVRVTESAMYFSSCSCLLKFHIIYKEYFSV